MQQLGARLRGHDVVGESLMSGSDSRVHRLVPETPDRTDRPTVRPDVPRAPGETLEPAVAAVLDRKDIPVAAG